MRFAFIQTENAFADVTWMCDRLGVSTSGFRISLLVENDVLPEAVRALHRELVSEGEPVDEGRS